jgi:hypothetical protein
MISRLKLAMMMAGVLAPLPVFAPAWAMGYDSLACPELAERRIEYFTNNGFSEAQLREADRTQVQMIIRTEARKDCPAK